MLSSSQLAMQGGFLTLDAARRLVLLTAADSQVRSHVPLPALCNAIHRLQWPQQPLNSILSVQDQWSMLRVVMLAFRRLWIGNHWLAHGSREWRRRSPRMCGRQLCASSAAAPLRTARWLEMEPSLFSSTL